MTDITNAEKEARKALFAEGLKRCSKCSEALPIDSFQPNARGWMGLRSRCRDCENVKSAEYRRTHQAQERDRVRRHWDADPMGQRLNSGAVRARRLGVLVESFTAEDLRTDWARRGISPDHDAYTGQPLQDGWHLDHAVPLSAPGTPGHVISNLVPTNPGTNIVKRRRHWLDYIADRAEALKEIAA
ncbi:hypothetical protein WSS_A15244 [Rhodococcus opacus M213]|uniref:HNH nuclease domain-containing protein n=2 Tax=Rhodococcus opacus TaxID=37919 RepID=K8XKC0_RHOOP|nr:hypothetical protein WSS_A15244 [Rhodococcus opacus M213]